MTNTLGQAERETATLSQSTLCCNGADREDAAYLFIFLNDTLTVEQSKTMSSGVGAVEDMLELLLIHPFARIGDTDFHIVVATGGLDNNLPTAWSELASIVSHRIDHKKCEGTVSLHHSFCGLHDELHTL